MDFFYAGLSAQKHSVLILSAACGCARSPLSGNSCGGKSHAIRVQVFRHEDRTAR